MDAMLPYLTSLYGNPHSRTHAYGWETEKAVEKSRKVYKQEAQWCGDRVLSPQEVADLIGADPREVVFTSGATESNNMAIKVWLHVYMSLVGVATTTCPSYREWLDSTGPRSVTSLQRRL